MSSERLKDALSAARQLPSASRRAAIEEWFRDETTLRTEALDLLAWQDSNDEFLDHGAAEILGIDEKPIEPGVRFGAYTVVRRIGRGGMSTVYLAQRDDGSFDKSVAIKVLSRQHSLGDAERRFRQEWAILARLDHPNIARLLDVGRANDGRSYLVMEYVEGVSIERYVRDRRPARRQILELFLKICDAAGAAHRQLVVHRDLKPSNILVTAAGEPKLIDFGISMMMEPDERLTLTGLQRFTPAYASPEQVTGQQLTTSTDIYSLGVVLYLLLTGAHPHQRESNSPLPILRGIADEEPRRPSSIRPSLRGDLDAVLLKALEKTPERRYRTVDQFREDIDRFLRGFPVMARTHSWRYLVEKSLRRHTGVTVLGVTLLLSIVIGAFAAIHYGDRAQRQSADILALAMQLSDDMMELHSQPGSSTAELRRQPETIALLTGLQRRYPDEEKLATLLIQQLTDYGNLLGHPAAASLGNTPAAIAVLSDGVRLAEDQVRRHPRSQACALHLSRTCCSLGSVLIESDNYPAAQTQFDRAIEMAEQAVRLGPNRVEALRVQADAVANRSRILLHERRLEECRRLRLRTVELHRQAAGGAPDWQLAGSLALLGWVEREMSAYDDALSHYRESSRMLDQVIRPGHEPFEVWSISARNLTQQGLILCLQGRHQESRRVLTDGLTAFRELLRREPRSAPTHRYMATHLAYLAREVARDREAAEARVYASEAVALIHNAASADPANHKIVDDAAEIHQIVDPLLARH